MGKYRAQMSLPNHLFGTIRTYDDEDAVTLHRLATGMLVRVDEPRLRPPVKPKAVAAEPEPEPVVEPVVEPAEVQVEETLKPAPRKRKATAKKRTAKKPPADVTPEPEPEPKPDLGTSSVQTSWRVAD